MDSAGGKAFGDGSRLASEERPLGFHMFIVELDILAPSTRGMSVCDVSSADIWKGYWCLGLCWGGTLGVFDEMLESSGVIDLGGAISEWEDWGVSRWEEAIEEAGFGECDGRNCSRLGGFRRSRSWEGLGRNGPLGPLYADGGP